MEPPPRVCAALVAAVLLLRAPGSADPPCRDCDNRSGPLPKHCPAGHFLLREPLDDTPTCTPCQPGTFMAWDNHSFESCVLCRSCDEEALQLTVRNCSAVADTECGCQPGSFPDCWDDPCRDPQEHLLCTACLDCGDHGRQPLANCSRGPQECGACLDGFYEHSDNCVPCPKDPTGSCPAPCAALCGWKHMFWVQVLLAVLVAPLLLGAVLIYMYHHCHAANPVVSEDAQETPTPLQDSAHTLLALPPLSKGCIVDSVANAWMSGPLQPQEAPCPAVPWIKDWLPGPGAPSSLLPVPPAGQEAAALQLGPQLYDVIDAVPARRWKEFVRTLGLREAEIEAVEVEVERLRDQQYEMLKRWRQQESAGLGAVYRALERMGLDGCAEDLRSRLQRGA